LIGFSGGKDSSITLQLVWEALKELPPEKLVTNIYVITVDTLVETPYIVSYIDSIIRGINSAAKKDKLPISAYKLTPKIEDSFWVNLIGKGYPAPSQQFRWCTDRLKIEPVNKFTRDYVNKFGEVTIVLGARSTESASRSQVLEKKKRDKLGLSLHPSLPGAYVFTPIEAISTDQVWDYLLINSKTPWGSNNRDLSAMYQNASGECPLVVDTTTPTCGNSRFGCWTCTLVEKDTSMENLIDSGEEWMTPLVEFRNLLSSTREPDRKSIYREHKRRDGKVIFVRDRSKLSHGPYKMKWRKEFLKRLLQTQKEVRENGPDKSYMLISLEELKIIRKIWKNEEYDWEDSVPRIYLEVMGEALPLEPEDGVNFNFADLSLLEKLCEKEKVPPGMVAKLIDEERKVNGMSRRAGIILEIDKVLGEEWRTPEEILIESAVSN
jgi:DNA sulfur modification protein DndC